AGIGLPVTGYLSAAWCKDGAFYIDVLDAGVYRSRDNAATFERLGGTNGFLYCDADGKRPFLAQSTATPMLSRWDGTAFSQVHGGAVGTIAPAPDGHTLFAALGSKVSRSTDGGASWSEMATLNDLPFALLALSADVALVIEYPGALERSTDGGATWTRILAEGITSVTRGPAGRLGALDRRGGVRRSV